MIRSEKMISTNNFKTGVTIQHEGNLYTVMEFQHVKPGKGPAFVRTKMRQIESGKVLQKIDLDKQYFGEVMTIKDGKIDGSLGLIK